MYLQPAYADRKALFTNYASRDFIYARLMAKGQGGFNEHVLAIMTSAWMSGHGALPARMGLTTEEFECVMSHYFNDWEEVVILPHKEPIDLNRLPEWEDLVRLMQNQRAGIDNGELIMAKIVAAGCVGMDHLWQDLGLGNRRDLSELMIRNFPALAARNEHDMKWKKFLYKQLCEQEGIYVCRAPSCECCSEYLKCFGPEE
jgi:nitrogen fixation protein NifQ